jgi:2-oxoglutarate ferredoxin oxidoreductase subunit alpha
VFVVSDLDIGMNDWMVPRFEWDDDYRPDRGKVMDAEALERVAKFSRFLDVDGDGIAARSLPGVHPAGAYFVRGSGHDKHGAYTEDADAYREVVDRIARKVAGAADAVPAPERYRAGGLTGNASTSNGNGAGSAPVSQGWRDDARPADCGLIALGGCHGAMREAVDRLAERGIVAEYLRIRGFPFSADVTSFIRSHSPCFVVEQNRDAQLRAMLAMETGIARDDMTSILDYGGLPLTAATVVDAVSSHVATVRA